MTISDPPRELVGRRYRWRLAPRVPVAELGALTSLDPLLAQLLWNRGLREPGVVNRFLDPLCGALGDPTLMAGLVAAVDRLTQALDRDELVAIYGDYDA